MHRFGAVSLTTPAAKINEWRARISALTCAEVSAVYRVSLQAVGLWVKRNGCPRNDDGTYDLPAVVEWKHGRSEESAKAAAADGDEWMLVGGGNSPWLERCRRWKAESEKLKAQKLRGELIEVSRVQQDWQSLADGLKAIMEGAEKEFGKDVGKYLYGSFGDFIEGYASKLRAESSRPMGRAIPANKAAKRKKSRRIRRG